VGKRLGEVVATIAEPRERLLAALTPLAQAAFDAPPASGGWSPGELAHHLALMDAFVARLLEKQCARAAAAGLGPDPSGDSVLGALDRFQIETAPRKLTAPEGMRPTRGMPRQELLDLLAANRAALLRAAAAAAPYDLTKLQFPHPVFGKLDMYQWILFVGQHELRHFHQLERGHA
jgi:hypothetical protein